MCIAGLLPVRTLALIPFERGPLAVLDVETVQSPGGFNVLYTAIHTDSTSQTQENRLSHVLLGKKKVRWKCSWKPIGSLPMYSTTCFH